MTVGSVEWMLTVVKGFASNFGDHGDCSPNKNKLNTKMTTQTDANTAQGLLIGWRSPLFDTNGNASRIRIVNAGPIMII